MSCFRSGSIKIVILLLSNDHKNDYILIKNNFMLEAILLS